MGAFLSYIVKKGLPTFMSVTGTIVKGVGTIHCYTTSFLQKVASKGIKYAILGNRN